MTLKAEAAKSNTIPAPKIPESFDKDLRNYLLALSDIVNGIENELARIIGKASSTEPLGDALYVRVDGTHDLTGHWTIATKNITLSAGTLAAQTVTGANVTSGADPGHTHTAYSATSHNHSGVYQPTGDYALTSQLHSAITLGVDETALALTGQELSLPILRIPGTNLFVGTNAGNLTLTGSANVCVGSNAGNALTTGNNNFYLGSDAGKVNATGINNVCIGTSTLATTTNRSNIVAIGYAACTALTTGQNLVAIGKDAMRYGISPRDSVGIGYQALTNLSATGVIAIGHQAGYSLTSGATNVFLGAYAGYNQTTLSNLLIVDNQQRADVATELSNAILYGVMAALPANQTLRANALFGIGKTPTVPLDVVGAILNTTTIEAGTGFKCGGTAAVADAAYANPTSITTKGGIVTAVSALSKTTIADPSAMGNADNEIGGLTISATYDQTEVTALRDKCEELADDTRAIHTKLTDLINALQSYGLV